MLTWKTLETVQGFKKFVTVTEIGRGKITAVLNEISKNKSPYYIVRNNKPEAAIITIEDLEMLLEAQENYELLQVAMKREKNYDPAKNILMSEIMEKYGITEEEIKNDLEMVDIE